ncbi:MAG: methylated-DNA--[protein]-cysteine S-methyltransferase [Acidimicrobiia bacterium]
MTIEDRLATLAGTAPAGVGTGALLGTGLVEGFSEYDSPVGPVIVTFNPEGVSSVDLAGDEGVARFRERFGRELVKAHPPRGWDTKINRAIDRGTPGDLPVDLRARSPFQRSILGITATIPKGEVRPYGWLAKEAGNPGAVRAVGSTMARNPVPLIIPCHRVVRTDGHIGNYSLGGSANKRDLLTSEGADPADLEALASRHVRYWGSDTTGIYCHPTCRNARRITGRNLVEFRSAQEAAAAGFRACQVCRP